MHTNLHQYQFLPSPPSLLRQLWTRESGGSSHQYTTKLTDIFCKLSNSSWKLPHWWLEKKWNLKIPRQCARDVALGIYLILVLCHQYFICIFSEH